MGEVALVQRVRLGPIGLLQWVRPIPLLLVVVFCVDAEQQRPGCAQDAVRVHDVGEHVGGVAVVNVATWAQMPFGVVLEEEIGVNG